MPSKTTGIGSPLCFSQAPLVEETVIVSVTRSPGFTSLPFAFDTASGWNGVTEVSATRPNRSVKESVRYFAFAPCLVLSILHTHV